MKKHLNYLGRDYSSQSVREKLSPQLMVVNLKKQTIELYSSSAF